MKWYFTRGLTVLCRVLLPAVSVVPVTAVVAQTEWTGNSESSADWSDDSNWTNDAPGATTQAFIGGNNIVNPVLDLSAPVGPLTMDGFVPSDGGSSIGPGSTLNLQGNTLSAQSLQLSAGSIVSTLSGSAIPGTVTVAGAIVVSADECDPCQVNIGSSVLITAPTYSQSAGDVNSLFVNAGQVQVGAMTSTGGTFSNSGTVIADTFSQSGTAFLINNGTMTIGSFSNAGTAGINNFGTWQGGSFTQSDTAFLVNSGTMSLSGVFTINGGTVNQEGNLTAGTISIGATGNFTTSFTAVTTAGTFTNAGNTSNFGTLNAGSYNQNAGSTSNFGAFTVTGLLSVNGGSFSNAISADGESTGNLNAGAIVNAATFFNAGVVQTVTFSNSGTVTNTGTLGAQTYSQSAGLTSNSNSMTVTGLLSITGGTFSNVIDTEGETTGTLNAGAIANAATFSNAGVVQTVTLSNSGAFTNAGTLTAQTYGQTAGSTSNTGTMTITNQLSVTGGTFQNVGGTSNVTAGTISIGEGGSLANFGTVTTAGGFSNAGAISNAGTLAAGTYNQTAGSTSNAGTMTVAGLLSVNGGTFSNTGGETTGNLNAGAITNAATFTNAGVVQTATFGNSGTLTNAGTLTTQTYSQSAGSTSNTGTMTIASQLAITGGTFQNIGGASSVTAGTISIGEGGGFANAGTATTAGGFSNAGTTSNSGTLSAGTYNQTAGSTSNAGNMTVTGLLSVNGGTFSNAAGTGGGSAGNLNVGAITNAATFANSGAVQTGAFSNTGTVTNAGTLGAQTYSQSAGSTGNTGAMTIANQLAITGGTFQNIGGTSSVTAGSVANAGTLSNGGQLQTAGLTNTGTLSNAGTLNATTYTQTAGTTTNTGTLSLTGPIGLTGGSFSNTGTVTAQSISNTATFSSSGTVTTVDGFNNTGTLNFLGGQINGPVSNNSGATFNITGTVASNSSFTNAGALTIGSGGSYSTSGLFVNNSVLTVAAGGTFTAANVNNSSTGSIFNAGTITDNLNNAGLVNNNGLYNAIVDGNTGIINNNAGATWVGGITSNTGTITNNGAWNANQGAINNAGTFNYLGGSITGVTSFTNAASGVLSFTGIRDISNVPGGAVGFVNNGTIAARTASDRLTINGSLSGSGTMNTVVANNSASIVIVQGASAGTQNIGITNAGATTPVFNSPQTVLALNGGGSLNVGNKGLIPQISNGLINNYLVQSGAGSSAYLQTAANDGPLSGVATGLPTAITALATGFFLNASAIVSRPHDPEPNQIGGGPFARVMYGNSYSRIGSSLNGVGAGSSSTTNGSTVYSGLQAGFDVGVYNIEGSGWNVNLGIFGGVANAGTSATTASAVPAGNSQLTTTQLSLSVPFVALYTFVSKGSFSAEINVRHDFYSGTISSFSSDANGFLVAPNTPLKGNGWSVNGNIANRFDVAEWLYVEPLASINWGKYTFDSINFNPALGLAGSSMTFAPIEILLGRLGANIGSTFLATDNLALAPFINASVWHDFAAANTASTQVGAGGGSTVAFGVTADRIGTFAQLGFGVNFKVLSADLQGFARADLLFGNSISGSSFSLGLRKQF